MRNFKVKLAICWIGGKWSYHNVQISMGSAQLPTEEGPSIGQIYDYIGWGENDYFPAKKGREIVTFGIIKLEEVNAKT